MFCQEQKSTSVSSNFMFFFPNALDNPPKVEVHRPPRITTPSPGVALGQPSCGWTKRCKRWKHRYTSVSIDDEFLETSWNIPEGRIVDSGLFFCLRTSTIFLHAWPRRRIFWVWTTWCWRSFRYPRAGHWQKRWFCRFSVWFSTSLKSETCD